MSTPAGSVPTQLIATSGPLATPESYRVPGSLEIQLSSVSAEYDGTGAGGSFDPTLSVYSKDGKLISRTKVGSTVTAGDSAVCTWIPFSRPQQTAPTPGATINAIHLYTETAFTIPPNNDQSLSFDHVSSFDSTIFGTEISGGRVNRVRLKKQGVYAVYGTMDWGSYAGLVKTTLYNLTPFGDTLSVFANTMVNDTGVHVEVFPMVSYTRTVPDAGPWGDSLPCRLEFWVNQDSAGNRVTNLIYWEFQYLGVTDF